MPISPEQARINGRKGGRPPAHLVKMSRKKADELAAANRTPLDVMIDNMNWFWDQAKNVGTQLEILLAEMKQQRTDIVTPDIAKLQSEQMSAIIKLIPMFMEYREKAQRCAVDAAGYVHPRFSSIMVTKKVSTTLDLVKRTMTPAQAAEAFASTFHANVIEGEVIENAVSTE